MINVLIPLAGQGKRFAEAGYTDPKPLIVVGGKELIRHSVETLGLPDAFFVFVMRPFEKQEDTDKLFNLVSNLNIRQSVAYVESGGHYGAAHSSLYAKSVFARSLIMDQPLIVTNCDQILKWDIDRFLNFIRQNDPDGVVVLHKSTNPKNSFAKIKDGKIVRVIEKDPISDDALIGVHYWKKASDFFKSAEELHSSITKQKMSGEAYVSETYNFLINKNKKILPYWLSDDEEFIPLGTPGDVEEYLKREH